MLNGYRSMGNMLAWFLKLSLQKNVPCGVRSRRQLVPPSASTLKK